MANKSTNLAENILPCGLARALQFVRNDMAFRFNFGIRGSATFVLVGPPGTGKTKGIMNNFYDLCRQRGENGLVVMAVAADREVTDIRGMALPNKNPDTGRYEDLIYTRSGILPPQKLLDEYDRVLILVDEMMAASPDHMKAFNPLLLDNEIGVTQLDYGKYYVVVTGNHTTHKAGATKLLSHTVNRCVVLHILPDHEGYVRHASDPRFGIHPLIPAFVSHRPTLFTESTVPDGANEPFATFRQIEAGVRSIIAQHHRGATPPDFTDPGAIEPCFATEEASHSSLILLAGHVGRACANEFVMFAKVRNHITSLDDIKRDPNTAKIPPRSEVGALFAQSQYCSAWCTNDANAKALLKYIGRFPEDHRMPTLVKMETAFENATNRSLSTIDGYSELLTSNHESIANIFGN